MNILNQSSMLKKLECRKKLRKVYLCRFFQKSWNQTFSSHSLAIAFSCFRDTQSPIHSFRTRVSESSVTLRARTAADYFQTGRGFQWREASVAGYGDWGVLRGRGCLRGEPAGIGEIRATPATKGSIAVAGGVQNRVADGHGRRSRQGGATEHQHGRGGS